MHNEIKSSHIPSAILISVAILSAILFGGLLVFKAIMLNSDIGKTVYPAEIIEKINQERQSGGLPPLMVDETLTEAAMSKAEDMATRGYFSHNTPDGRTPWYFMEEEGYSFMYAGENLAVDFFDVEEVTKAWMESPGHRANIMNIDFSETGIGVARGTYEGREVLFYVQMFGRPVAPDNIAIGPNPSVLGASTDDLNFVMPPEEQAASPVLTDYVTNPTVVLKYAYYALTLVVLAASFAGIVLMPKLRTGLRTALYGAGTIVAMWTLFYVFNAISFLA